MTITNLSRPVAAFCFLLLSVFISAAQQAADAQAPEGATAIQAKQAVVGSDFMVATANPLATQAGFDILAKGGSAIDAMVSVQLVLGLVEPQSSGIGGGAFLVYFDGASEELTTYDGRETAPMAATPTLFLDEAGEPIKFFDAVVGGRSVGTPGTLRLLFDTHEKHGKLEWAEVVRPAIELAEIGFEVSPRLHALLEAESERLKVDPTTSAYFHDAEGNPHLVGDLLKNPEYAQTLRSIAKQGADAFYKGPLAQAIVDTVRNAANNPGVLSLEDLAGYRIKERQPVCILYRGFDICGMGPPSSGALTVGQILGILEPFDLASFGPDDPQAWQLIGEASRLAFADRSRYMADIDYVPMPLKGLLDRTYLEQRSSLIEPDAVLSPEEVKPGEPAWDHAQLWADDESIELPSTSHFSIVDSDGNVVSMTTTIENGFGSRLMTSGFLLNNELTDFSFRSHNNGTPIANRVEPGKRPRSSMAPTIVLRDGKPYLAVGSTGGSRIIGLVAKTLIAHIDWGLDIQSAVSLPHLINRFGTFELEEGTTAETYAGPLESLGFEVAIRPLNSGLHGIVIADHALIGGADPRREGTVLGQ